MPNALIVVIFSHFYRNCKARIFRAQNNKCVDSGEYDIHDESKQVLAALKHKDVQGIIASAVERTNIGLRIVGLREIYKVTSCHQETDCGAVS